MKEIRAPNLTDEKAQAAFERADKALRSKWETEQPEEPEKLHRFVVTIDCTWSVWESIKLALRGFPVAKKLYRQEPVPNDTK